MDMDDYMNEYYKNDAKKLRKVVDKLLKQFGGINDPSEFYSLADEVFFNAMNGYDGERDFDGFLYSCLDKKIKTEMTRRNRDKRTKYARGKDGKKIFVENEKGEKKPVVIHDIRLDAPISDEDKTTYGDCISSKTNMEEDIFDDRSPYSKKTERFLSQLSSTQRKILMLLAEGWKPREIQQCLSISHNEYSSEMAVIYAYENISILL